MTLSFDPILIPQNASFTHESTSWAIYKHYEIIPENLIHNLPRSVEFKETFIWDYSPNKNEVVYVTFNVHYSHGEDEGWSRPMAIREGMKGFKLSNTIIATPTINILEGERNITGDFTIETSDYLLYAGKGIHNETSYYVQDTAGNVIWKRERESNPNFLTSFKVKGLKLNPNQSYVVLVQHHNDLNTDSNYGKVIIATNVSEGVYGNLTNETNRIDYGVNNYFQVDISVPEFKKYSWFLTSFNGDTIAQGFNISVDNFEIPKQTTIKNGKVFILTIVFRTFDGAYIKKEHSIVVTTPVYHDCLHGKGEFFNIVSVLESGIDTELNLDCSSMQMPNGDILMLKEGETQMSRFRYFDSELEFLDLYTDINLSDIDTTRPFKVRLINKTTLVVSGIKDDNGTKRPMFWIYDYNRFTGKSTYRIHCHRLTEEVLSNNLVSFISLDNENLVYVANEGVNTNLYKLNYYSGSVEIIDTLGVDLLKPLTIADICHGHILIVGNNNTSIYTYESGSIVSVGDFDAGLLDPDTEFRLETLRNGNVLLYCISDDGKTVCMRWDQELSIWMSPTEVGDFNYVPALVQVENSIIMVDYKESSPVPVKIHR